MKTALLILCILFFKVINARQLGGKYPDGGERLTMRSILVTGINDPRSIERYPVFSLLADGNLLYSYDFNIQYDSDSILAVYADALECSIIIGQKDSSFTRLTVRFSNRSSRKISIENVVPFGISNDHVYITADGTKEWPQYLCRSRIYRPGYAPVGIVLPDNAWHLGWSDIPAGLGQSVSALCRRTICENAGIDRWASTLEPGGYQEFSFYLETHSGGWQQALELAFRKRFLYNLEKFDNSLFQRSDLGWIRHAFLMVLKFAWDKTWIDPVSGDNRFYEELTRYDRLTGGWDIFTLWPTWPRLGLDERNQFDLYEDLPGGLSELRKQSEYCHNLGKKYFISYNPWDESTRHSEHMAGLEKLLSETDADGIVLDCKGGSSYEFQATADRVKPGIIMYSEGMAVPKDMPGIVAGRVHNALFMPPPINMNKFIKPDFAIFRVVDLAESDNYREIAVAFFNGYGVEFNMMRQGRPERMLKEMEFAGQTARILRENTSAFTCPGWKPFIETLTDSIWVNEWKDGVKQLFTVFSLKPEGYFGPLFKAEPDEMYHWISLWNHSTANLTKVGEEYHATAGLASFDRVAIGTRREGSLECIARLPCLLLCSLSPDTLTVSAEKGDEIRIWAGNPSYAAKPLKIGIGKHKLALNEYFPGYEDKFVVQLMANGELLDEVILEYIPGTPRLVSVKKETVAVNRIPPGMVEIPAGKFDCSIKRDSLAQEPFISLPRYNNPCTMVMKRFFMDTYPVTNQHYYEFIQATRYTPKDTVNFLKNWGGNIPPAEKMHHPVVFVSLEDAKAYANWAGKRLPTEVEWQYAAQGTNYRKYPWGNTFTGNRCNNKRNQTTEVTRFPKGKSPFGVMDLIGNVWQLTNDEYDNGSYRYVIIRGGSYYYPDSSIWYVTGGPVSVSHPEILLRISPSLERCSTVGFRCVKDSEP